MPAVRRPRAAQPQTSRCRYVDGRGDRCRRVATIGGGLCRQHAIVLELELDDQGQATDLIGEVDRALSGRGHDPFATVMAGALNGLLGRLFVGRQEQARRSPSSLPPRSSPPPPRPRPQPAPPPPDPTLRAREILGFELKEPLSIEKVQKRKQALARIFHPDMQGGSEAQMKRINAAADALLAKLS